MNSKVDIPQFVRVRRQIPVLTGELILTTKLDLLKNLHEPLQKILDIHVVLSKGDLHVVRIIYMDVEGLPYVGKNGSS